MNLVESLGDEQRQVIVQGRVAAWGEIRLFEIIGLAGDGFKQVFRQMAAQNRHGTYHRGSGPGALVAMDCTGDGFIRAGDRVSALVSKEMVESPGIIRADAVSLFPHTQRAPFPGQGIPGPNEEGR